jgi:hypothetical protein
MRRELCKWCKQREPEFERALCTECLDKRAEARGRNPRRRAELITMYRKAGTLYGRAIRTEKEP